VTPEAEHEESAPAEAAPEATREIAVRALSASRMVAEIQYARMLAESGLLPKEYRNQPANVLFAVEYGTMLNLPPMAAITGIHIIEGKPTASAGLISGLVRRAGHKLRVGFDAATMTGWASIHRADDPGFEFRSEWNLDRALTAELCTLRDGKPYAVDSRGRSLPWRKFFPSMTKRRAITEVARDACEEVLFGLHYTPEELTAETDDDGNVLMPAAQDLAATAGNPWQTAAPAAPATDWPTWAMTKAATFTDWAATGAPLVEKVGEKFAAGKITGEQASAITGVILARKAELDEAAAAAAGPVDAEMPEPPPLAEGDPWADKIADLATQAECDAAEAEVFELIKHRQMAEDHGDLITAHIRWKASALAAQVAA
jgi:hypothetical protein